MVVAASSVVDHLQRALLARPARDVSAGYVTRFFDWNYPVLVDLVDGMLERVGQRRPARTTTLDELVVDAEVARICAVGRSTEVFVCCDGDNPRPLGARYAVVDINSLAASHLPESFRPNPRYPEGLQERTYHWDDAEQQKVVRNARNLLPQFLINTNPDSINGPPVVTSGGLVIGGNSRVMSLQIAFHQADKPAAAYRALLAEQLEHFGLAPGSIAGSLRPALVRIIGDEYLDELPLLVRQANENFTGGLDPRVWQVAMGRRLSERAMAQLTHLADEQTLNDFLDSKDAEPFIRLLWEQGIIDQRNANQYTRTKTWRLNEDGKRLVARILVGRVVADADLLSDTKPSMVNAIARAVPYMLKAEGAGSAYTLRDELRIALDAYNRLQHRVADGSLAPLNSKTAPEDLQFALEHLRGLPGITEDHQVLSDPRAEALLRVLILRSGTVQIAKVFRHYARLAAEHPEGQVAMIGMGRTPLEVFEASVEAATSAEQAGDGGQVGLFGGAGDSDNQTVLL